MCNVVLALVDGVHESQNVEWRVEASLAATHDSNAGGLDLFFNPASGALQKEYVDRQASSSQSKNQIPKESLRSGWLQIVDDLENFHLVVSVL